MSYNKKLPPPRSMPIISRESYNLENAPKLPNWMDEFANNLSKQSVESKVKADKSIYDQISSIMGNKSKYSSVEDAVIDMQERSGMKDFLNKLQSLGTEESTKKAEKVMLFENVPQAKDTVDNYISGTNGNLPIPAIVEKIKSVHRNDISEDSDLDDNAFLEYINNKSIEEKKKHPGQDAIYKNLGKIPNFTDEEIDPSNSDALFALNPAVITS